MSEQMKEDGAATELSGSVEERWFKLSVDRWVEKDGEYRQLMARRYEALKLIGSGHGAGLVAVAAFLNASNSPQGWSLVAAKLCWIIFSLGVLMFCAAYYKVYAWELEIEKAVFMRRIGREWDFKHLKEVVDEAVRSLNTSRSVMGSIVLFGLGMCIIFFGVLLH